jgi:hypothetical protein
VSVGSAVGWSAVGVPVPGPEFDGSVSTGSVVLASVAEVGLEADGSSEGVLPLVDELRLV